MFPFVFDCEVWVANATYINHDVCPAVTIVIPCYYLKQNPSGSALFDPYSCTSNASVFVLVYAVHTFWYRSMGTKCFPLFFLQTDSANGVCVYESRLFLPSSTHRPFELVEPRVFIAHSTQYTHVPANFPFVVCTCSTLQSLRAGWYLSLNHCRFIFGGQTTAPIVQKCAA